jgi:methyltransferase (TIGR00027 family)
MEAAMARIENVTGTAFVVAQLRAEENAAPAPLYHDGVVGLFLSEESKQVARRVTAGFPPARDLIRIRTRYFYDLLDRHLQSQCRQVVVLGAGLDTRAVRKGSPGVTYFEIDDAFTLKMKQACYDHHGFKVDVKFIPGNYVTDGLIDLLAQNDFDFELPTYVIWEGNTMYLPLECLKQTLAGLRNAVGRFQLSFDYMAEEVVAMTTGDPGISSFVEGFANMGAPWVSGICDVHTLAGEMGLTVIENFTMSELHRAYGLSRPIASPIYHLYSVCTLGRM